MVSYQWFLIDSDEIKWRLLLLLLDFYPAKTSKLHLLTLSRPKFPSEMIHVHTLFNTI